MKSHVLRQSQDKTHVSKLQYDWTHWRHLANTSGLLLPSTHPSPQPERQIDRFSHFCTAYGRKYLYFTMDSPFPNIAPSHRGSGPASNTWFFVTTRILDVFAVLRTESPRIKDKFDRRLSAISGEMVRRRWPDPVQTLRPGVEMLPRHDRRIPVCMPPTRRFYGNRQLRSADRGQPQISS